MTSTEIVFTWIACGVLCALSAQMAKRSRGTSPWGFHPLGWGVIGLLLGIFGLLLELIAEFTTRRKLTKLPTPSTGSNFVGMPMAPPPMAPPPMAPPPMAPPPGAATGRVISPPDTATQVSFVAGWYSDPSGRHELRYWDGQRWTANVSTAGVTSVDEP